MIKVEQKEDGSFDISWDKNHPVESALNTWTEEDFIEAIMKHLNKVEESK